jgi:hypothetical protein
MSAAAVSNRASKPFWIARYAMATARGPAARFPARMRHVGDDVSKGFRFGRSANGPSVFGFHIDGRNRRFTLDATDASERDAGELRHLGLHAAGSSQEPGSRAV